MEDQILSKLNELIKKIDLLDKKLELMQYRINHAPILNDPNACIDQLGHDYPFPWFSTAPPFCKKCGKQGNFITFTYDTTNAVPNIATNNTIIVDDIDNEEDDLISSYGR